MTHSLLKSTPSYRLSAAGKDLAVVDWGDVQAVYQRSSGETHVFNPVTAIFLQCLGRGSGTIEELVKAVGARLGVSYPEDVAKDFLPVVYRLEELGLIEVTDRVAKAK